MKAKKLSDENSTKGWGLEDSGDNADLFDLTD